MKVKRKHIVVLLVSKIAPLKAISVRVFAKSFPCS